MSDLTTFSGTIVSGLGAVLPNVPVTFTLIGPGGVYVTSSSVLVVRTPLVAITDAFGVLSQVAVRTDKITPAGCYWQVDCEAARLHKALLAEDDFVDIATGLDVSGSIIPFIPANNPDNTWVAHGHAQALADANKYQAISNLGLGLGVIGITFSGSIVSGTFEGIVLDGGTAARSALNVTYANLPDPPNLVADAPNDGSFYGRQALTPGGTVTWQTGAGGLTVGTTAIGNGTDQALLYQDGTTLAELTLGTNLSITAGVLNASGGGSTPGLPAVLAIDSDATNITNVPGAAINSPVGNFTIASILQVPLNSRVLDTVGVFGLIATDANGNIIINAFSSGSLVADLRVDNASGHFVLEGNPFSFDKDGNVVGLSFTGVVAASNIPGYPADGTKYLDGSGTWTIPAGGGGGSGDVVGPAGATDGAFALFDTTTGKLIKDGGTPASVATSGAYSDLSGTPSTTVFGGVTFSNASSNSFQLVRGTGQLIVTGGSGVAGLNVDGVAFGDIASHNASEFQPVDSDLTSWAAITRASGFDTFAATPSSVNLAALITNETGSGALVFATSPTLVTPVLGTVTSGNFSTGTFTWPTFNQNTSGSAATLTTVRTIGGSNFDGSANVTSFPSPGAIGGGTPAVATFTNQTVTQQLLLSGDLTPTALGGDVNDYNPTSLATALTLRIDGGVSTKNITGLQGGAAGRVIRIVNVGTTNSLVIPSESASSSAANRFLLPADLTIQFGAAATFEYDSASSRWRPWASNGVASALVINSTTISGGTDTRMLYNSAGVLSEKVVTGSGNAVLATSPSIGGASLTGSTTITSMNGISFSTSAGSTVGITAGKTLLFLKTLTFDGTDSTTITFQGTDTYVGRATTDTLTNKSIAATQLTGTIADARNTVSNTTTTSMANLVTVGTLTGGATGAGFTIALTTSTVTGTLADARLSANVPLLNVSNTFTGTTNTFTLATTTGTTTTAGIAVTINSLTSGTGIDISSTSTTAAANHKLVNISLTGANGTSGITTTGALFSNTKTGTTSTNIAATFTASGATTNTAINITAGDVAAGSANITTSGGISATGTAASTGQIVATTFRISGNTMLSNVSSGNQFGDNSTKMALASGSAVIAIGASTYTTACAALKRNGAGIDVCFGDGTSGGAFNVTGTLSVTGNSTFGTGTAIKNIRHGISGAMVLGTVTVTDTGCTANTRYFFSAHTLGTISIPGGYYASTRTASTSFVITSSQATETSTIDWMAIEP